MHSANTMEHRALLGFLWLAVLALTSDAVSYNESQLEELYEDANRLYWESKYHWDMSSGYNDMLGVSGMKICFVDGPELEALVLGGDFSNTSSSESQLELQHGQSKVSLPDSGEEFTVSLWYSFRPVDFFDEINDTMACDLLRLGSSGTKGVAISYNGKNEYNLTYRYQSGTDALVINDNDYRPNWEFEVNDTTGEILRRGWQWNHIAVVKEANKLTAYYNGLPIANTTEQTNDSISGLEAKLLLNIPVEGKPACAPVGFDEVALWTRPLTAEEILALRVHVGRNRSLDELYTTEAGTTEGDTTAEDSTAEDTTAEDTTAGDTMADSSTVAPDVDSTMESSTPVQSTGGLSSSPDDADISTGDGKSEGTRQPTTQRPTSTGGTTRETTQSPTEMKLDALAENITIAKPKDVTNVLKQATSIVAGASDQETALIADNVVDLLDKSAAVLPANENSSSETIAALSDYRKAFVNLFSSVLVQWDKSEKPTAVSGDELVQVMDTFLTNYVEDPTAAENESIFSNGVDVRLAPANGSVLQMDVNTSVTIPDDAFDFVTKGVKIVVCLLKRGLQNVLEPKGNEQPTDIQQEYTKDPTWNISGPILVMRVAGHTESVQLKKNISFEVQVDPALGEDPECVFQGDSSWSGKGVYVESYDKDCPCVTCKASHLTNFAVLMAVDGVKLDGTHAVLLSIISYIGCSLSLLCLIIAIIMFIILRELNSTRMGIVKNMCVALFLAQLLFVAGIETAKVNEIACKAVAALLHYFFLCVIAWMLCNGIYLYQKVQKATRPGSVVDLIYFCILGWGAPAIVVAITAGVNHKVYGTDELCWLSVEGAGIWAFVAPAMAIILFNAFVTFLTMKAFVSVKVFKDKSDKDKFKSGLRAVVVMLPILGLSWIFGLLAFGESGILFQYLFATFNSLQGVFLFIFHILLNDEVKGAMRRRFGKVGASGDENMLFNKIWAFSSSAPEKSTEMSSVTQTEKKPQKLVYKN